MQAALATRRELKMLDCICQPDTFGSHLRRNHHLAQETTGWTDKGTPFQVLTITRLFSYNHELSVFRPFTPNSLGCGLA